LDIAQEQSELIKTWDNLDNACGSVLDRYGANFGVQRLGTTDEFYRLAIKVKLMAQISGGDINTILNAAAALYEIPVEKVIFSEIFPAKIGIDINEADLTQETLDSVADIKLMLKRILAVGIGLIMTLRSYRKTDGNIVIKTALFDRNAIVFGLPEVKRKLSQTISVNSAMAEYTKIVFKPIS